MLLRTSETFISQGNLWSGIVHRTNHNLHQEYPEKLVGLSRPSRTLLVNLVNYGQQMDNFRLHLVRRWGIEWKVGEVEAHPLIGRF